ncbi:PREDICTED: nucleolar complex protein 4 homolog B-like [Rhagoletis zephyria]|uniref:nucleolar complex protein 4 homolog B-like n=1 Tax=Rhagoletis zephyria TaxID=28612 RepID=UPI00081158D2|nr:PREDICTED: nucleolar complex protein 4 homolog B-like [Rhagoletis zephyria]
MENDKRSQIAELNKLASTIIQDPIHSNQIIRFIDALANLKNSNAEDSYIETLIRCVAKIFNFFIDSREWVLSNDTDSESKAINSYKSYLIGWYDIVIDELLKIVSNEGKAKFSLNIQKLALTTLIKFVEEEGKFPFRPASTEQEFNFPSQFFSAIIRSLLSETTYNQELIAEFVKYYQYDDVIHFTLKALLEQIDSYQQTDNSFIAQNIVDLIFPIRLITPKDLLPKSLRAESKEKKKRKRSKGAQIGGREHTNFMRLCELQSYADSKNKNPIRLPSYRFKFDYVRDAKLYSTVWVKYLYFELQPATYKRVLVYLDKYAIQHFENPLLLANFLTRSFAVGGIISLLSLSPLYTLIHKCNFDYPNFFAHLYQLLQPAITYVKYRARFLFWADLFLTSTHISSQIVAAFAKQLARLALTSPPDTILIILPFIGNLFIRHPITQSILNAPTFEPERDPFLETETNPEKSNAIDSYMWELKALQSHYLPEIAQLAKQICEDLPAFEWNLADVLETNMDDVVENAKKTVKADKFTYDVSCDLFNTL